MNSAKRTLDFVGRDEHTRLTAALRLALTGVYLLTAAPAAAQSSNMVEPRAGAWKTWVLNSGSDLRLPPPPTGAAAVHEVRWLKEFMAQSDTVIPRHIRHWDAGAPPYRWIEMFSSRIRDGRIPVSITSFRGYALLSAAMYDATIAAWYSKYAYNRPPPSEFDPTVRPAITTVPSPSYPSEHATVAGAAATVLSYLFPAEAESFNSLAAEAARSRLFAGVHHPSDMLAGLELGRAVGRKVVEYALADRTDAMWTGTIPTGPGFWIGTTPVFVAAPLWKPWFLDRANEFRPAPPPAYDSPQRAAELAELRNFPRTFQQQRSGVLLEHNRGNSHLVL